MYVIYIERVRKEETVPQPLAVCASVFLCVILGPGSCRASSLGRVSKHEGCSPSIQLRVHTHAWGKNQCDLPVVHLTKDVKNVVLFFIIMIIIMLEVCVKVQTLCSFSRWVRECEQF